MINHMKVNDVNRAEKNSDSSIFSLLFFAIIAVRFCVTVISHCITSGNPLYISKIGEPSYYGGILVASFMIASIGTRILSGALVDIFSRKRIIFLGSLFVLSGSLISIPFSSLFVHILGCVLQGIGFSMLHTAVTSATADVLPTKRLGEGISYAALGQSLGMAIGPSVALWLIGFEFNNALSIGTAVTATLAFILGFTVRYEKHPERLPKTAGYRIAWEARQASRTERKNKIPPINNTRDDFIKHGECPDLEKALLIQEPKKNRFFEKKALHGALPMLFVGIGVSVFFSYTALFAKNVGYENPSVFFISAATATVVIRLFFSRFFNTSNLRILFFIPIICGITALLGVYFIRNEIVFGILGIGHGIGIGMSVPILNSVAVSMSPPDRIGPANALFYLMYDAGTAIGALLWGFLFSSSGFMLIFIFAAVSYLIAYLISLKLFPYSLSSIPHITD